MASTKDKKKKRRRRARPPPAVAVKATDAPKAIPTSILLEQQAFGRLIKNARTAGLEINQSVYDRYQENIHVRSVLARHNRPDLGERLGYQARQMVRNLVVPRGHAPARERSQRIAAETIPVTPAPAPDPRPPASPAREGEIEEEKTVTWAERMAEGEKDAIDVSTPPVEGRKQEAVPLPKNDGSPAIKIEPGMEMSKTLQGINELKASLGKLREQAGMTAETAINVDTPQKEPSKGIDYRARVLALDYRAGVLAREAKQLNQEAIKQTPPGAAYATRAAMRGQESSSVTPPTEE